MISNRIRLKFRGPMPGLLGLGRKSDSEYETKIIIKSYFGKRWVKYYVNTLISFFEKYLSFVFQEIFGI